MSMLLKVLTLPGPQQYEGNDLVRYGAQRVKLMLSKFSEHQDPQNTVSQDGWPFT